MMMTFMATCIETTARFQNTTYQEVYQRMKQVEPIERFILPHYERFTVRAGKILRGFWWNGRRGNE